MQKSSSPSKRPATAGSPGKSVKKTVTTANGVTTTTTTTKFTVTHLTQGDYSTLQLMLKERDIELEDKMNTLSGLEYKLSVFEDLQKDVEENKAMIRDATDRNRELQVKFQETAQKVSEDTDMKKQYQDSLLDEIKQLKEDIQERARQAARKEQEHIDEMARQKQ